MNLNGAKINFLGDSITEGYGTSSWELRFTDIIAREYGVIARNHGIGGTRYARQNPPSEEPIWDLDFCKRCDEMDPDADAVVVFGGTNDYGHGNAPFGQHGDTTAETFCGACQELYTKIRARFPNAKILVITPLHRLYEDCLYGEGRMALRPALSGYVQEELTAAEEFGFAVLDLFNMELLNPNDPATQEQYVPDGLHPNDTGHQILAKVIAEKLQTL